MSVSNSIILHGLLYVTEKVTATTTTLKRKDLQVKGVISSRSHIYQCANTNRCTPRGDQFTCPWGRGLCMFHVTDTTGMRYYLQINHY
jgi:hypothetical protein